jgi:hypothetical protein
MPRGLTCGILELNSINLDRTPTKSNKNSLDILDLIYFYFASFREAGRATGPITDFRFNPA